MPETLTTIADETVTFARHPGKPTRLGFFRRPADNTSPPYKFAYARTALKYGLKHVGLTPGDALLVPDFICESAVEPLGELGVRPVYYPVGSDLAPDWPNADPLVTPSTKALLIVHYFGQPQEIPACLEFCRAHSLMLIEDNAHGFGGTFEGQPLGTFGDVGISAPRKSFAVASGAYLHLANGKVADLPELELPPVRPSSIRQWIKRRLADMPAVGTAIDERRRSAERRRRLGPPPAYGSQWAFRDPPLAADYGMDEATHEFLMRQDLEGVREKRRRIYEIWQQWAEAQGLTPVFPELAHGAIPLVFPAFTGSAESSQRWFERGHRVGIDIHSWPTLPECIVKEDGPAMRLWERLVFFPIHQDMDHGQLEERMEAL